MSCIHCSEKTGKLAVAWGSEVPIFNPFSMEDEAGGDEGAEEKVSVDGGRMPCV